MTGKLAMGARRPAGGLLHSQVSDDGGLDQGGGDGGGEK